MGIGTRETAARRGMRRPVSADVRRLPHALDRSAEFRPDDSGQRRRHRRVVRRRVARAITTRTFPSARSTRSASTWTIRTTSTRAPGSRALARSVEHGPWAASPCGTGSPSATTTASSRRSIRPTAGGSTRRGNTAATRASIRRCGYETNIWPRARPGGRSVPVPMGDADSHLAARQKILYTGGQMLLRSTDRGDHWTRNQSGPQYE